MTQEGTQTCTVTGEDATAYAGQDIKSFADSASQLQSLMQSLSLKWSGVRGTLREEGVFRLNIRNNCQKPIDHIAIKYYLDGELIGTRVCSNADHSALAEGETVSFEFVPEDFPAETTAIGLSGFSFDLSVTDADGNETEVCTDINVSAKYAWTYTYTLDRNETGLVLNQQ